MSIQQQYREYLEKVAAYEMALNTMYWDQLTIAPKKGQSYRTKMMSLLSGELFDITTDEKNIALIEQVMVDDESDEITKIEAKQIIKDINTFRYIPKDEYVQFVQLLGDSEVAWEKAKQNDDWDMFKPYLEQLVEQTKRNVRYRKSSDGVYQQLLEDFEPNMSINQYDEFFNLVKEKLVPLIKKINEKQTKRPAFLDFEVSLSQQKEFINILSKALYFSKENTYTAESVHPFSSSFSVNDNRVTVAYHTDNFTSSIFSFIHEVGHATYNGQVDPQLEGRFVAHSMSYGMHESQSRMFENMIGRSKAFWKNLFPQIVQIIPELQSVSLDEFIFGINYVSNSLIRIEADELTYPLHVLVRYEIEKALFNDEITVDQLPTIWNEKMQQYLQVKPSTHKEGVLQDVHWSGGSFGYFPTYALGSAYSAQWYHAMSKSVNIEKALSENRFDLINDYLKTTIHKHGGIYSANELFEKVCDEPFNPSYYIDYLTHKYSKLFNI